MCRGVGAAAAHCWRAVNANARAFCTSALPAGIRCVPSWRKAAFLWRPPRRVACTLCGFARVLLCLPLMSTSCVEHLLSLLQICCNWPAYRLAEPSAVAAPSRAAGQLLWKQQQQHCCMRRLPSASNRAWGAGRRLQLQQQLLQIRSSSRSARCPRPAARAPCPPAVHAAGGASRGVVEAAAGWRPRPGGV